ncbi:19711_t:CDS:2 [Cetraspora pellucida]|uniref:19711_t:CDS:1 n=1 Tax=Cetraspora pellucida TaxID=1433469 RepID=A0A9N9IJL6_9GLOM|nr:19711_t:CDS:2 [Cetraspora pellucida]
MKNKSPTILIIGAGPGGLCLAHALEKNKNIKQFNVKIFDREFSPTARWQGYHVTLYSSGVKSLIQCVPTSLIPHIPHAIPDTNNLKEEHIVYALNRSGHKIVQPPTNRQFPNFIEFSKYPLNFNEFMLGYRDVLRDILLQDIEVQWGKKCVGYEEVENGVFALFEDGTREFGDLLVACDGINSVIRKQKLPHLKIQNNGIINIIADIAPSQQLISRLQKYTGNSLMNVIMGSYNDCSSQLLRMIPINDEREIDVRFRMTIIYSYAIHISPNTDDIDRDLYKETTAQIINEVKTRIAKTNPEKELTKLLLELWDLVPLDDSVNPYPFKKFNPPRKKLIRHIDPKSIPIWESTRVTLLGDAIHAMEPSLGLEILSKSLLKMDKIGWEKCIWLYENEMRQRTSRHVVLSTKAARKLHGIYRASS